MELVERDPKVLKGLHNSNELRITQEIRKNFKRSNQQFSFMNVLFYGILIPIYNSDICQREADKFMNLPMAP